MEITTLSDEEQEAILAPPVVEGPSQEDLLRQIESDYLGAQRDGNSDMMAELDARHARVKAASDAASARQAYEYREPVSAPAENPPQSFNDDE